jgi:hypothetical protein
MYPVFFIGLGIVLFIVIAIFGAMQAAKRRQALLAWAQSKGLSYTREKDRDMRRRFAEFKCLDRGSNRYAYNVMTGEWSSRRITAFDYHYETHSTDPKGRRQTHHHRFSAVVLESDLPLKSLFIRPEGFFDKITEFFGADDIDFESAEFSRKFYVKAKDRRWAYDVIHARTMQFLLDMPTFTIQFDRGQVIAFRGSRFKVADFETAVNVIGGVLDRLPDYLVKQLKEEG